MLNEYNESYKFYADDTKGVVLRGGAGVGNFPPPALLLPTPSFSVIPTPDKCSSVNKCEKISETIPELFTGIYNHFIWNFYKIFLVWF